MQAMGPKIDEHVQGSSQAPDFFFLGREAVGLGNTLGTLKILKLLKCNSGISGTFVLVWSPFTPPPLPHTNTFYPDMI